MSHSLWVNVFPWMLKVLVFLPMFRATKVVTFLLIAFSSGLHSSKPACICPVFSLVGLAIYTFGKHTFFSMKANVQTCLFACVFACLFIDWLICWLVDDLLVVYFFHYNSKFFNTVRLWAHSMLQTITKVLKFLLLWIPTYSRTSYLHLFLCERSCTRSPTQGTTSTLLVLEASKLLRFGVKVDFLWVPWSCLKNISHLSLHKPGCYRVPRCRVSGSNF